MRITTWICLLGFASVAAFAACGGDDDDNGQTNSGGGSSGASGGSSAGAGGTTSGGAGGAAGGDGSLRLQIVELCQDRCTSFDALNCRREDPIDQCDRACTEFAVNLSTACLSALVADYQCVKGLGRDAYECNADGKPAVASDRRACQAVADDVIAQCGREGLGGAGGAAGAAGGGTR